MTFTVSSGNPRYDAFVRLRLDMTIIDDVVAVESLLGALGVLSGERSVPQWRRPSMEPDARRIVPARSLGPLARPTH